MSDLELVDLTSYRTLDEDTALPKNVRALELLQMAYRGEIELTSQQFRAAKEALPFEEPKLGAMAVGSISGQDFASLLDRAIRASGKEVEVKQIEPEHSRQRSRVDGQQIN
jgi:hypothetical protein